MPNSSPFPELIIIMAIDDNAKRLSEVKSDHSAVA